MASDYSKMSLSDLDSLLNQRYSSDIDRELERLMESEDQFDSYTLVIDDYTKDESFELENTDISIENQDDAQIEFEIDMGGESGVYVGDFQQLALQEKSNQTSIEMGTCNKDASNYCEKGVISEEKLDSLGDCGGVALGEISDACVVSTLVVENGEKIEVVNSIDRAVYTDSKQNKHEDLNISIEEDQDEQDDLNISLEEDQDEQEELEFDLEEDQDEQEELEFDLEEDQDEPNELEFDLEEDQDEPNELEFDLEEDQDEQENLIDCVDKPVDTDNKNSLPVFETEYSRDSSEAVKNKDTQFKSNSIPKKQPEDDNSYIIIKNKKPVRKLSKQEKYATLTNERLMVYVTKFLTVHGVSAKPVNRRLLDDEFGRQNIQKLIKKSMLIQVGSGITFGL